jgi:hypothetical protein
MLVYKLVLGVFFSLLLLASLILKERIEPEINKSPKLYLFAFFLAFRLFPFLLIYVYLGFDARSDVLMFYDSAVSAAKGAWVYRDFESAYSPLFPYFTVLPLWIWESPKAIILQMILLEFGILLATIKLGKASAFQGLLYLLLPASFILSVLGGQEDIFMWGGIVLALLIFQRNKNYLMLGVILGLGLLITKALLVLLIIVILIALKERINVLLGLLLVGIPSLIILYFNIGWDFLAPIQQANDPRLPNIWSILHPLTNGLIPLGPKWLNWVGLLSILFVGCFYIARNRTEKLIDQLPHLFLVVYMWMMVSQQSSVVNYAYTILMPLLFWGKMSEKPIFWIVLVLFNFAVILQAPLWWGMGMIYFHSISDLMVPSHALEYFLEILIVGSLFWFLKNMLFLKK